MKGAFEKPMPCSPLIDPSSATTPSNSRRSASCARSISSASVGSTMMLTWMLPSPAWPKHGIRQAGTRGLMRVDEREQLGNPPLGHDDVVVELERRDHLAATATARGARATAPAARPRRARAALRSRRPRGSARSTRVGFLGDRRRRRRRLRRAASPPCRPAPASAPAGSVGDGLERIAVDQLERRRHDARPDDVA